MQVSFKTGQAQSTKPPPPSTGASRDNRPAEQVNKCLNPKSFTTNPLTSWIVVQLSSKQGRLDQQRQHPKPHRIQQEDPSEAAEHEHQL
jgi:hypothetical protein